MPVADRGFILRIAVMPGSLGNLAFPESHKTAINIKIHS